MWIFLARPRAEGIDRLITTENGGKAFFARSGPWGKGMLPVGRYLLGKPVVLDTNEDRTDPYTDEVGNAWWCPLRPQFTTDRSGLGIHPDGNIPGTRGCIGIVGRDTTGVFALLREGDELLVLE